MEAAIGIFDSGLGGITVVKEVQALLPAENIIYLGDTARVPYGTRSPQTIARYALEAASFLFSHKVKMLVVACNSASSAGMDTIRKHFSLPIREVIGSKSKAEKVSEIWRELPLVEVIAPGAIAAIRLSKNKKIGVIGTTATVNSAAYKKAIQQFDADVEVYQTACPLFVSLVEEGWEKHPVTRQIAEEYLSPLKRKGIDTLILGCTHYPLLQDVLQQVMGETVTLVNSGREVALVIQDILISQGLQNNLPDTRKGTIQYYVTDIPQKFVEIGERFLGKKIQPVEQVEISMSSSGEILV